jgi:Ca2+-binding RTX toxin-like protein
MAMGRAMIAGRLLALAAACAALALPASALAATVGVEEDLSTDPRQAKLIFAGATGEANRLTVSVAGEEGDFLDLRLLDSAAPVQAGPGCSGGGAAGTPVLCRVHKPTVGDGYTCFKGCIAESGTAWDLTLSFALGNAGSRLDTTALPASIPNKSEYSPSAPIEVAVVSGAGDDTVLTGPGPDEIGPSRGADLIRTGDGRDVFRGGPVADGPDDVDLGDPDEDTIDYSERREDVHYDPNGLADDGAPGEGDELDAAGTVSTGAGADTLVSASEGVLEYGATLSGGRGADRILGSPRSDSLFGGPGDDDLFGGAGNDWLLDPTYGGEGRSGNDSGDGGPGGDHFELGSGDDEASGGPGRDEIEAGPGDDRVAGGSDHDRIRLGSGRDSGEGGDGSDLLLGEAGDDEIEGGAGKDRLSGDVGRDSLLGGEGDDLIAAGMAVTRDWGRAFLEAPGPLEGESDRVACGTGRDEVKIGAGDTAAGCERSLAAGPLELRGVEQADVYFPARLKFTLRRPGTLRLSGRGVEPRRRVVRGDYMTSNLVLRPVDWSRGRLGNGRARFRLRISFRAVDGREVIRFRTVDLWTPVDLGSGKETRSGSPSRPARAVAGVAGRGSPSDH